MRARSIVHGVTGELTCTTARGVGTSFTMRLRAAAVAPAEIPVHGRAYASRASCHVVLVDDERQLVDTLTRILRRDGHHVTGFADPRKALEHLAGAHVDVVVSDLAMPYLNGRQFYEAVVARRPELARRFVFVSGGTTDPALEAFLMGFEGARLDKPFRAAELCATPPHMNTKRGASSGCRVATARWSSMSLRWGITRSHSTMSGLDASKLASALRGSSKAST